MAFLKTSSEICQKFDVSPSRLSRWKKAGKLKGCVKKIGGVFHYDEDLFEQAMANNVSKQARDAQKKALKKRQEKPPTQTEQKKIIKKAGIKIVSLNDAQALKANYDAALKKLEYEQKSGDLLQREAVEKSAFETGRKVRDAILNIPDRIGAELAAINDVFAVKEKLTGELIQALEELSGAMNVSV